MPQRMRPPPRFRPLSCLFPFRSAACPTAQTVRATTQSAPPVALAHLLLRQPEITAVALKRHTEQLPLRVHGGKRSARRKRPRKLGATTSSTGRVRRRTGIGFGHSPCDRTHACPNDSTPRAPRACCGKQPMKGVGVCHNRCTGEGRERSKQGEEWACQFARRAKVQHGSVAANPGLNGQPNRYNYK